LERRLARAREVARLQHKRAAALRLAECLAAEGLEIWQETGEPGLVWSLLAERDAEMTARLEAVGKALFGGSGLAVRITGPWPPYAFARAAWQEADDA
jgi:hypothetical protein